MANDKLPETPQEQINRQAEYYSGFNENEDHTPLSKGKYYGYIAGATAWAGWKVKCDKLQAQAQAMADALEKALAPNYRNDKGYWVHPNIVDAEILDAVESALQQFKDGEKEVENG